MSNCVAFLCSILVLIVFFSYTDGQWHDERWNYGRQNDERWNYGRQNDERWNNERRNDERWDDRRSNGERRNNGRLDNGRRNDEISNNGRRTDEGWNSERQNNDKSNDERRNNEISNGERRNGERRNDERRGDNRNEEDRFAEKCPADKKEDWTYRGNNGPLMWTRRYPGCGGRAQSPVAINSHEAIFDEGIEKLKFQNYHIPIERATIENNGHTIEITPRDDVRRAIQIDHETYDLRQMHFHWGDDKSHGSEHTIDSIRYALEMHLVHQSSNGQTAVAAVFFKEQSQASKELQNIIQTFPKLLYNDSSTEVKSINLNNLLPANHASYYRYEGSLTTPPCTEGVQWVLMRKIMPVGTKQMAEFRKLYSSSKADANEHCKISNNYRPLQSLNGRKVGISQ